MTNNAWGNINDEETILKRIHDFVDDYSLMATKISPWKSTPGTKSSTPFSMIFPRIFQS